MFNLDGFIRENPKLFPSTFHEDYQAKKLSIGVPKWLEDVGLKPQDMLGEGSFKNYHYDRASSWSSPSSLPDSSGSGFRPAPLPGPNPLRYPRVSASLFRLAVS